MERALNPFNPGAGLRPPALVGRDAEIQAFDATIARAARGLANRGMVLSGLRGVGKTVLLNELRTHAERADWLVVAIEGQRGERGEEAVRRRLARELLSAGRRINKPGISARLKAALGTITSFGVHAGITGISLDVSASQGRADSGDLETDLAELIEDLSGPLSDEGKAFGLFVDEMQDLDGSTLSALLAAQHEAGQRSRPFYVVGAGLPSLPGVLSEARSYAERLFEYRKIGPLPTSAAKSALLEPVEQNGAAFSSAAVDHLTQVSEGYPYFLQEYGRAVWDLAPQSPFTLADAQAAEQYGLSLLDDGFFRARWDRATPAERKFLAAMAADDGQPSAISLVADRLNRGVRGIGPSRAALIHKGLVYAPDHGLIAYTVPGMANFISRQPHV